MLISTMFSSNQTVFSVLGDELLGMGGSWGGGGDGGGGGGGGGD